MSGLRRAILLALACASGPVAAMVPAPAIVASSTQETSTSATAPAAEAVEAAEAPAKPPTEPFVLFPLPVRAAPVPVAPSPSVQAPAAGSTVAPELVPPPAAADAEASAPIAPADREFAPARPTPAMTSGEETFARLRRNLRANSCDAGSNSARWRQRYAGSPGNFSRRLQTVLPLLDFVSVEVERARLPAEFTFIPLVESWYQPAAIGPGGPAGMWQMIATTARNHGIHIREGYDGRLSPVESTRAALSYLTVLQDMFGDWQAIVMAYNAGEGRMQHAMRRAGSRVTSAADRRPHGLSNITYDYVDKLQALSCLVSQPHRFGLHLPVETRFEPLVPLLMDPGMQTLEAFARARGKDVEELKRLNPGFRGGRVVAGVPRLVLAPPGASPDAPKAAVATSASLPLDLLAVAEIDPAAEREIAELLDAALLPEDDAGWTLSAEPPATAAMTAVADGAATEAAGRPDAPGAATVVAAGMFDPPPPVHTVREGESLWSIAKYYQLPVEQIRRANGLDGKATVHPGQVLQLVP